MFMQRRKFITSAIVTTTLGATMTPGNAVATKRTTKGFVVKSSKSRFGETTRLFGTSPNDIKVSSQDTGGNLTIFEYAGHEKGGPPMHIHPHQDEIFYVLEDDYAFEVGGEKHRLTPGDTIFMPRNVPHAFAQLTDSGRMIFFLQPDNQMEDYFREVGKLTPMTAPQEGPKLFASHDMQVVGPPLTID